MLHSIATVSLSGNLHEKLIAIAAAGFRAVEIFENDFLTYNGSAREMRKICRDLNLDIICYQPFRDFEGLPQLERAQAFSRAEHKFDLMEQLGTDLLLICSSVHPKALGGIDRAADDFSALGEIAAKRNLRVGYEALAWGKHVSDYRDAWEIVRRANHSNIGLILDSFHLFSRGLSVDAIRSIPGDRIFLVQLADAPKLHLDALSWSRHFRCFPGQGDLDAKGFSEAVAATGYAGPQSLEIFNDQFRAGLPKRVAEDAKRSMILLEDQMAHSTTISTTEYAALPDKASCHGVAWVEFSLSHAGATHLKALFECMGFSKTGIHITKSVERWTQGDINLIINTEPNGFAHSHQITHGPGVCAIGLQVGDVQTAMARATRLRAHTFTQQVGPGELEIPAIRGVGGSLIYFVSPKSEVADIWRREFKTVSAPSPSKNLTRIDHISQSMPYDEILSWDLFYRSIFDLSRTQQVDIADPSGLVQSHALISADSSLRVALNGSMAARTSSSRFLSEFFGAGVQHIAFETSNLLETVEAMRARGLDFLEIPDNYYDDLQAKFDLDAALFAKLRANRILYDRDANGEFFQIYTHAIGDRFFFELVERRNYDGFGAANAPVRLAAQSRDSRPASVPRD